MQFITYDLKDGSSYIQSIDRRKSDWRESLKSAIAESIRLGYNMWTPDKMQHINLSEAIIDDVIKKVEIMAAVTNKRDGELISFWVDGELKAAVSSAAALEGLSKSAWIRRTIIFSLKPAPAV